MRPAGAAEATGTGASGAGPVPLVRGLAPATAAAAHGHRDARHGHHEGVREIARGAAPVGRRVGAALGPLFGRVGPREGSAWVVLGCMGVAGRVGRGTRAIKSQEACAWAST